jgi:hypothetical protein
VPIVRRSLIIGGGVAIAAAGLGGVVAVRRYDQATKIDRSVPSVVVREYVDALFVRNDDDRVALFTCGRSSQLGQIEDLRHRLTSQDATRGTSTQVVVRSIKSSDGGHSVETELELNEAAGVQVRTQVETWRFGLVDEHGWRVCSAERLPDPSPTASPSTQPTGG